MPKIIIEVLVFNHVDQCVGLNPSCERRCMNLLPSSLECQVHVWTVVCSECKNSLQHSNLPITHPHLYKKPTSYVPTYLLACYLDMDKCQDSTERYLPLHDYHLITVINCPILSMHMCQWSPPASTYYCFTSGTIWEYTLVYWYWDCKSEKERAWRKYIEAKRISASHHMCIVRPN